MIIADIYGAASFSKDWFDSDSALALANNQGGNEFMTQYPHYRIRAYVEEGFQPGHVPYWSVAYFATDFDGSIYHSVQLTATLTSFTGSEGKFIPTTCELRQNYPNPFNPTTSISFELPEKVSVKLGVYNLAGQEVAVLADGLFSQGIHTVQWRPGGASSGIYFVRLQAGEFRMTRKIVLLR
jgi:hypothetical protein